MTQKKDYYQILGVKPDAGEPEIKTAYRRLARKYHPDISKEHQAEDKFKELQEAYAVLKDPQKRAEYDNPHMQQPVEPSKYSYSEPGTEDINFGNSADFFESLFHGARHQEFSTAGADYHSKINLTLEEAYNGGVKHLQIPTQRGVDGQLHLQTLKVTIPTGVRDGQHIRLSGQGAPGYGQAKPGDLYLKVHVSKHPVYEVIENDIYLTLPVAPWEAALGASIAVPTLGGPVELKIPANSQGGQKLRIRGKGMPGTQTGDQYIILKIVIPQAATPAEQQLFREMAAKMPFNPREKMGVK